MPKLLIKPPVSFFVFFSFYLFYSIVLVRQFKYISDLYDMATITQFGNKYQASLSHGEI